MNNIINNFEETKITSLLYETAKQPKKVFLPLVL